MILAAVAIAAVVPGAAEARYKVTLDTSTPTATATFTEASSTPDAADLLTLREDGTRMRHNRKDLGDSQFASGLDFDTSQAGNQYLSSGSASRVIVNAGGGADAILLGRFGNGAHEFETDVEVRGQAGDDLVLVDTFGDGENRFETITPSQMVGLPGIVAYSTIERLTFMAGEGNDHISVNGAPGVTNLITRGGNDQFIPGPPSVGSGSLKGGFYSGGDGTDKIDYVVRGSGSADLTRQRFFEAANLDAFQENPPPPSPAFGYGSVRINPTTDVFDVDVFAIGLIGGPIVASHIHRGEVGTNGPVIFDLGVVAWKPASPTAHSSLSKLDRFDPDTNPLNDVNTATLSLMPSERYFNVHTDVFGNGEVRGQIFDASTTAGPASAVTFAANVEAIVAAPPAMGGTAGARRPGQLTSTGVSHLSPFAFKQDGAAGIDTGATATCGNGGERCSAIATARSGGKTLGAKRLTLEPGVTRKAVIRLSKQHAKALRTTGRSVEVRIALQQRGGRKVVRSKTVSVGRAPKAARDAGVSDGVTHGSRLNCPLL